MSRIQTKSWYRYRMTLASTASVVVSICGLGDSSSSSVASQTLQPQHIAYAQCSWANNTKFKKRFLTIEINERDKHDSNCIFIYYLLALMKMNSQPFWALAQSSFSICFYNLYKNVIWGNRFAWANFNCAFPVQPDYICFTPLDQY